MKGLSHHVVKEFCALCDWAYHANQIHRHLFDNNPHADKLRRTDYGCALAQLSSVTVEYAALQIAKLHDKAVVAGNVTLSIDYVMTYGGWEDAAKSLLVPIRAKLDSFAEKLRHARNKALSHNDLAAIVSGGVLGTFEENEDLEYFQNLEKFADVVSREVTGEGFTYSAEIVMTASGLVRIVNTLAASLDA
ncbi:hypothetical protein [Luteimonas panaciterrae]|uniref:AbiU2 domain-containing protein n=1 Tax=Luteimonas panaciterrae TaxID=363885 RepID=UPI001CFA349C|nr:hypothetical protein [Luteimonas panaciterrae]